MRIVNLLISNFKSIQNATITDLRPITGIWGRNSAGKSNLLHAIITLRNMCDGTPFEKAITQHELSLGSSRHVKYKYGSGPTVIKA